jgi:hypothetical protein
MKEFSVLFFNYTLFNELSVSVSASNGTFIKINDKYDQKITKNYKL